MKSRITIMLLLMMLLCFVVGLSGCANWSHAGVDGERLSTPTNAKEARPSEINQSEEEDFFFDNISLL
jgi:hypothetical protein